jgi:pyruvate/2-oxoglutarate dehydrogenase complex dihydrolipoamide acyltransferase (E2) component
MDHSTAAARRPVLMPAIEVGMDAGRLVEFLVRVDSTVTLGQPLFLVEADKATLEIEAPAAGRVVELCVQPDTEIPVGAPVLILEVQREVS